ncbi:Mu transposase C-terminal domain-containing protein [Nesterenkonia sp. LB17]|uniref:Mu transposase C-terminal domain-containing protein n=1 Tax=Nesterenkonia sp. LB17 TaxID=2901230 RepID=UPI001F4D169E|nr:Mu transposase C-terminal domain-containing protein [Nesterenkonia sp. LB17]MCH8565210.1 Mu transposase C-terminal domain-containing protein [Nesterenkonia sp. LB17]
MRSVRLFDYISYDGDSWQVVAQDGPELALKSLTTNRIRRVPVADLLSDESYLPDSPDRLPSLDNMAVLDTLAPEARERVLHVHRHVYELLNGVPPNNGEGGIEPKTEYDLANTLEQRIEAKVEELRIAKTPMSKRTLKRHISSYRAEGMLGLVDKRKTRQATVGGRTDPRVVALLEKEIAGQTNLSTGTRSRAILRSKLHAQENGWPVPSDATLYRVLTGLERSRSPFGQATTRRSKANRPDRAWGHQTPSRPGELVEIDSTPLDLMVVYPDGSTGRVDLTAAIDVATRVPVAAILRPVATKAVDAAVLLARALTPLPMQPGWDASLSYSRSILPQGMIPSDAEVEATTAAKPIIVPESITMDRGKAFKSVTFMNACERLQISLTLAAPKTPTDKPHIESFFRGVRTGFVQHLAGYVGPNVVQRGADPAREAHWGLAEVQNLLDLWIIGIYLNRPSRGLRHPAMPKKELTPNEAFAALAGVAPQVHVALERDDFISLMPVVYRTIQPSGINFDGLNYESKELADYRGVNSGLPSPASGRWEVRYDPHRMNSIWVRDHFNSRWIEARWILDRQALAPFSRDVLKAAKRMVERRDGTIPGKEVVAEINRILTAPASTAEKVASRRSATNIVSVPEATDRLLNHPNHARLDGSPDLSVVEEESEPSSEPVIRTRPRRKARRIDLED